MGDPKAVSDRGTTGTGTGNTATLPPPSGGRGTEARGTTPAGGRETRAEVEQRLLRELTRIARRHPRDGDARRVPVKELFATVPLEHAGAVHGRLEPGAPRDDFALYLRQQFPVTRAVALETLRDIIDPPSNAGRDFMRRSMGQLYGPPGPEAPPSPPRREPDPVDRVLRGVLPGGVPRPLTNRPSQQEIEAAQERDRAAREKARAADAPEIQTTFLIVMGRGGSVTFTESAKRWYRVEDPFFDPTLTGWRARAKAALDASNHYDNLNGLKGTINDYSFLGIEVIPMSEFDANYEDVADYVDQYHVTLESLLERPNLIMMGAGRVVSLARHLPRIFPQLAGLAITSGRQLMGLYRVGAAGARGHHIFAKSAFPTWVWDKMIAISQEAMEILKWNHGAMTTLQGRLYRDLYVRVAKGHVPTMRDHITIAKAVLRAGGATVAQRRWIVAHALRNLRQHGIRNASRIPTFGRPPRLP